MLSIEEVMREVSGGGDQEHGLPPGFRFHPTDEELITYYLASKVYNFSSAVHIAEVDLNRCEPWDLPEGAKMGEREWYLFSVRDRKYPTGVRTNRATEAGYWKATGKDRQVFDSSSAGHVLGIKKTLVFYKGRAPRGLKTNWVMHEYRLHAHFSPSSFPSSSSSSCNQEWVMCRIYQKGGDKKSHPLFQCLPALLDNANANANANANVNATNSSSTNNALCATHDPTPPSYSTPFKPILSYDHHMDGIGYVGVLDLSASAPLTTHISTSLAFPSLHPLYF